MTSAERAERTRVADALCEQAYAAAGCPDTGVALVAVGGYGRGELAPFSDLDVVLVHEAEVDPGQTSTGERAPEWAQALWYPLWDSGTAVDHAVRSLPEMLEQGRADLKAALGMLDVRLLAGDADLTLRLRTALLADWRREARRRLPELHELVRSRGQRTGELADAAVPDLKESAGGLRDATVLKALVATWLVDVPHADLERTRHALLDARDALHAVVGRGGDRVPPEYWPDLAVELGLPDALAAQRHVRGLGRRLAHLSRLTWRRVDAVLRGPAPASRGRRPELLSLGGGVAISHEEVVLDRGVRPEGDPLLLLRAAAEAAERDLVLAPATAGRLARSAPDLSAPWPAEARDLLVRLLGSGPGLLPVWETLEETGATDRVLPEWGAVRLLPHASTVHRFTVDRHLVQTCVEAAALVRRVARPDVLLVAALLHDIGKAPDLATQPGDHSVVGEPLARGIAQRLGFDSESAERIAMLVRHHLLLPDTATRRDPEDPATVSAVLAHVPDREQLDLLSALTEADARATSEQAWTRWRSGLVEDLVRRAAAALAHRAPPTAPPREIPVPAQVLAEPSRPWVEVSVDGDSGCVVTVVARDRVGLLADCAALFALQRAPVRAARSWGQVVRRPEAVEVGVSQWSVARDDLDGALLRQRLEAITDGEVDVVATLASRTASTRKAQAEPVVAIADPAASEHATVLEVRAANRPGLVHTVCRALAGMGLTISSAHVATLGAQAVDAFYVQEVGAGALSDDRAAEAAHAVRAALVAQP